MTDTAAPRLDDVVEELYGLPREHVIARRDDLVKQARAAGDKDTATAIAALRKPSVAAWLANQLAREHPDEVGALAELGASLRAAQERLEGDALRRLSRQRQGLVHALVDRARRIAREDGVRVGDAAVRELERTVTAALADDEVAAAFATGALVTAIEPGAGLGDAAAPAGSTRSGPPRPRARRARADGSRPDRARDEAPADAPAPVDDTDDIDDDTDDTDAAEAEERRAAWETRRRELLDARDDADDAARRAREQTRTASREADDAQRAATRAADVTADLRDRLAEAEQAQERTREEADRARAEQEARDRDAAEADEAAAAARQELADHDATAP